MKTWPRFLAFLLIFALLAISFPTVTLSGVIQETAELAGKPVFLGEFGVKQSDDPQRDRQTFSDLVDQILDSGTALAAFWVYDFSRQDGTYIPRAEEIGT